MKKVFMTLNFIIHDIGHKLKNGQAALERGTHFEGKQSYDSINGSVNGAHYNG